MGARNLSPVRKITRRGKTRWVIDIVYVDKHGLEQRYRHDAQVQTREGAHGEARQLLERLTARGTLEAAVESPTLREFVDGDFTELCLPQFRPATRERYLALTKQGLLDELGRFRLNEIDTPKLLAFSARLVNRGVQDRPHLNLVRTILREAQTLGRLARLPQFPKPKKRGKKIPDAPSFEDVAIMLAKGRGWLRVAIALAVYAGLRMGEVRALEVRDIDFQRGALVVRHTLSGKENALVPPKSGSERDVPLAPELRAILAEAVKWKLPTARVVLNDRGRTPSRQHVLMVFKALEERLGLPDRSFHQLRHFFCSTLVRHGVSVEVVRVLAGHSTVAVTQRYLHAVNGEFVAAISRLSGNGVVTEPEPK